jgi:hypothetical protein
VKYWIGYKVLILNLSLYAAVVSFTSPALQPSALTSFLADAITSYLIVLLYPEIDRLAKDHVKEKVND